MLIEDSNDGVLGIRQADGQVIRYEKDNDGNYHSNTSALEILKKQRQDMFWRILEKKESYLNQMES